MTKKEQLRRRMIELIHGLPYEEVYMNLLRHEEIMRPISLSMVVLALTRLEDITFTFGNSGWFRVSGRDNQYIYTPVFHWALGNVRGMERSLDDQSEETREALHQLLCTE